MVRLEQVLQDKINEEAYQKQKFKEAEIQFDEQRKEDENELKRLQLELQRLQNEDPENMEAGDLLDNEEMQEALEDEVIYDEGQLHAAVKRISQKIVMRLKIREVDEKALLPRLLGDTSTKHSSIIRVVQSLSDLNNVFMLEPEEAKKVGIVMKNSLGCQHLHDNVENIKLYNAFRELIGHYNVLSKSEQIQVDKKIYKKYVKGKEDSLREELDKAKDACLNIDDVQKMMQICGCKVDHEDLDYIHFQMYLKTNDFDDLDFGWLIEISDNENMVGDDMQQYVEQEKAIEKDDYENSDEN